MKRFLTVITVSLILALALTGCGKKNAPAENASSTNAPQTDVSSAYADAKKATSDTDKKDYDGSLGKYDISIEDAKLINVDDMDIVVISFEFKNNNSKDTAFTAATDVEVTQDSRKLPGAVVSNIEGVNLLSMAEQVPSGDHITVQRAYTLNDSSLPVTVTVKEFGSETDEVLTKTFEF